MFTVRIVVALLVAVLLAGTSLLLLFATWLLLATLLLPLPTLLLIALRVVRHGSPPIGKRQVAATAGLETRSINARRVPTCQY